MKSILTIGLISTMLAVFAGCSSNQPIYEGDSISDEEQQEIQDIIDADQAELNEEPEFEEGEISEEAQQEIQDIIDADQASLEE